MLYTRSGLLLHAMGNVEASFGHFQQAWDFHTAALNVFETTVGNKHHRYGDMVFKLAEHTMREGAFEIAR